MHWIKNIVYLHLLKRMLGLTSPSAVPKNDMKVWDAKKRAGCTSAALVKRDLEFAARQALVIRLRAARDEITAADNLWILSAEAKEAGSERMRLLVCPQAFYSHRKNLFQFTGSWDTIDWQHFAERWGLYALYDAPDRERYRLLVQLFTIIAVLVEGGQSRNQYRGLKRRALVLLREFCRLGPLQDHTVEFHKLIELIDQAIRWGDLRSVWCYQLERALGYLMRNIKSKRNAEANIMSRFRSTLVPCSAYALPQLSHLEPLLAGTSKAECVADRFPKRIRGGHLYEFSAADVECLHTFLIAISLVYKRIAKESASLHNPSISPGVDIQRWKPWLPPKHVDSKRWARFNPTLTLSKAVQAFRIDHCKTVSSAVWFDGAKRTGSATLHATSEHAHAHSVFRSKPGSHFIFGKILFIFELQLQAIANQVRLYSTCICLCCKQIITKTDVNKIIHILVGYQATSALCQGADPSTNRHCQRDRVAHPACTSR
jgi:hypothetical protein